MVARVGAMVVRVGAIDQDLVRVGAIGKDLVRVGAVDQDLWIDKDLVPNPNLFPSAAQVLGASHGSRGPACCGCCGCDGGRGADAAPGGLVRVRVRV